MGAGRRPDDRKDGFYECLDDDIRLIALYILVFLAAVAGSVLFGCAVYNDAKSKWNDNATMWGVLVGILG